MKVELQRRDNVMALVLVHETELEKQLLIEVFMQRSTKDRVKVTWNGELGTLEIISVIPGEKEVSKDEVEHGEST